MKRSERHGTVTGQTEAKNGRGLEEVRDHRRDGRDERDCLDSQHRTGRVDEFEEEIEAVVLERLRPRDGDCPWGRNVLRWLVIRRVRRDDSEHHATADDGDVGVKALVSQLKPETHARILAGVA